MNIKDTSSTKSELTLLNTEMIIKDEATENELGFVQLASEDTPSDDNKKAVTKKILNDEIEDKLKVIDGGTF